MSIQDGGPAFPVADYDHMVFKPKTVAETKRDLSGMSLRDYFAAKALQGLCSDPSTEGTPVMEMAEHCYGIADAMLAARCA